MKDAAAHACPVGFLWANRIPVGWLSWLFAPGGSGKSTLALALAVAAAGGHPLLGSTVKAARAIYIDAELNVSVVCRIARMISRGLGIPDVPDTLFYHRLDGSLTGEAGRRELRRAVDDARAEVVILDSFEASAPDLDAVSLPAVGGVLAFLASLQRTVVVVDHTAKSMPNVPVQRSPYGAAVKLHRSRGAYRLQRGKDGEQTLVTEKSNFNQAPEPLRFTTNYTDDAIRFDLVERLTLVQSSSAKRVEAALVGAVSPMRTADVAARAGVSLKTAQNRLGELAGSGKVIKAGRALWLPPETTGHDAIVAVSA